MRSRLLRLVVAAVPTAFLGYFFVYPLATILITGFTDSGAGALSVLSRPSLRSIAWFTLWQAAASTILTVLIALPTAYTMGNFEFRGKQLAKALITVPFVMPTVVVGAAFLTLFGPGGFTGIDLRRTVWAILLAHVFFNFAVVVRTVGSAWEKVDPSLSDAAAMLGADRWTTWRRVVAPLVAPAVASAASIVFLFSFTSFGVVLILGDLTHTTIEVEIWRQATTLLNLGAAAALAVFQLAGITAVLWFYASYQRRRAVRTTPTGRVVPRRPRTAGERWWVAANMALPAILLGSPLVAVVIRSLRSGGWSLANYEALIEPSSILFVPAGTAIANSLRIALIATLMATGIGMALAFIIDRTRTRIGTAVDTIVMLPLGTSAVTLGFGFLLALDKPIDLRTSFWLIPIAHALVAIPFVVRTALPVLRSIDNRLREAAAVLGADPARVWREIEFPIVRRAVLVGGAFAFAMSMGEFGATSFIARPGSPTLPIAIYRLLTRPGSATFGQALAAATVLMAITGLAVLVVERWRGDTVEDF